MYYIVNEANSQIVDSQWNRPTEAELIDIANYMQCDVYVISGEHSGMTASPSDDGNGWTIEEARKWWEASNHKCECGNEIPTLEDAYQHGVCLDCLQKQNQ